MSRLSLPISGRVLWSTGDVRLWLNIGLLVKDSAGSFVLQAMRVDSGTDITTFPAYDARQLGLPMPATAAAGVVHMPTGLQIRSGVLRFRVVGMDQTEYATPCLFLGDPAVPPPQSQPITFPRKLLQPLALLDYFRFEMDKDPTGSLYGEFVITKK